MIVGMTPKKTKQSTLPTVEIEEADRDWISPEIAAEVLKRAADGSKPLPWSQVEAELAEMDRWAIES
jgi:hypothetical protein